MGTEVPDYEAVYDKIQQRRKAIAEQPVGNPTVAMKSGMHEEQGRESRGKTAKTRRLQRAKKLNDKGL